MNQAKLRDWLEIIGIFAVVASLIFARNIEREIGEQLEAQADDF